MPLYVDIHNLIVQKSSIIAKYVGGLQQFREDYNFENSEVNQEDDELFLVAAMNFDDYGLNDLMHRGLHFDEEAYFSKDFVIVPRYGDWSWQADWLEGNSVFVWHWNTSPHLKEEAIRRSKLTLNQITEMFENDENPFKPIV
jgi:hypothetical protein